MLGKDLSYFLLFLEMHVNALSVCRTRLNKLLAKEQALRQDVTQDRALRKKAEPTPEQVSIISPQNLQDTK